MRLLLPYLRSYSSGPSEPSRPTWPRTLPPPSPQVFYSSVNPVKTTGRPPFRIFKSSYGPVYAVAAQGHKANFPIFHDRVPSDDIRYYHVNNNILITFLQGLSKSWLYYCNRVIQTSNTVYLTLFGMGGDIFILVLVGLDFVSWIFFKNFQTFLKVKIYISNVMPDRVKKQDWKVFSTIDCAINNHGLYGFYGLYGLYLQ